MPCYNPHNAWAETVIDSFKSICTKLPDINIHLIIVNDGSAVNVSDHDIEKISKAIPFFTYIHEKENKGKGHALREGIKQSTSEICIYTDIDFPYTIQSIIKIWGALKDGSYNIAAGIKNEHYYEHVPFIRKFISKSLRVFTKIVLRLKIADTQCGLKGFDATGKAIFLNTTIHRYLFDLEFIYLASRNKNIKILAVPIDLREHIEFSQMNMKIVFTESLNFLKIFLKSIFNKR